MNEKFHIVTYGCQMNKCDSEVLASILSENGYLYTQTLQDADIVILNTCSVRDTAERKVIGKLGRLKHLKRRRPDIILCVCGCMAQSWGRQLAGKFPFLDIILGTNRLAELPDLIRKCHTGRSQTPPYKEPIVDISEAPSDDEPVHTVRESSVTAWVTIMHGCNNFCSYCIVPYVRGRERSRSSSSILREVKSLGKAGYKEITLLGQNVNSYGKACVPARNGLDVPAHAGIESLDFAGLLALIDKEAEGIERVRFTTSHPKDVSPKLIDAVADLPKVCKHFHLPAQAGSDNVLARMNRGYTRQHYIDLVHKIRERVPDISITTDLIVGFPGETEQDFSDTLDLVREVEFDVAFCFRYSTRRNTPASAMEDQVSEDIKMRRLHELLKIQDEISMAKNEALVGTRQEVLVEGRNPRNESQITGRTSSNKIVFFPGHVGLIGQLVTVTITGTGNWSLRGEQYGPEAETWDMMNVAQRLRA